jgi:hypothetical protein
LYEETKKNKTRFTITISNKMNDTNNITSDNNIDTIITVEGLVGESELAGDGEDAEDDEIFKWTWITIIQSIVLFLLAGIAEIIGGWMVWYVTLRYVIIIPILTIIGDFSFF